MVTTRPCFTPRPLYRVATPVPASEIQNGLVAERDMAHAFFNCGSVLAASPGMSEARLVCTYCARADVLTSVAEANARKSRGAQREVIRAIMFMPPCMEGCESVTRREGTRKNRSGAGHAGC